MTAKLDPHYTIDDWAGFWRDGDSLPARDRLRRKIARVVLADWGKRGLRQLAERVNFDAEEMMKLAE